MLRLYHLALLLLLCTVSSCVTLFNGHTTSVRIIPLQPAKLVNDTARFLDVTHRGDPLPKISGCYELPPSGADILVRRARVKLPITIKYADTTATLQLKPTLSRMFYLNFAYEGLGCIVDLFNKDRFSYWSCVYVDRQAGGVKATRLRQLRKGDLSINFSIPYINGFVSGSSTSTYTDVGFWGITAGSNYAYSLRHAISVQAGTAINFPAPFPAPFDKFGDTVWTRNASTLFINTQHRTNFYRFDVGYGLAVATSYQSRTLTVRKATQRDVIPVYDHYDVRLSASLSAYYRLTNNWYTGVLYQPGIVTSTGAGILTAGHFISLDVQWRFRL